MFSTGHSSRNEYYISLVVVSFSETFRKTGKLQVSFYTFAFVQPVSPGLCILISQVRFNILSAKCFLKVTLHYKTQ